MFEYRPFFVQAEDGIGDIGVTGVQTCALPISPPARARGATPPTAAAHTPSARARTPCHDRRAARPRSREIGRASCREGVEVRAACGTINTKDTLCSRHGTGLLSVARQSRGARA